ncbi:hypothetical protein E1180_13600 [Roseibium denhamense]|uniref:Uncharacterized protein n=1 Tax=Roseibium denhamense TaxID=76305 RepID=A0ABY1NB96_9HYPH|nr:hypothetical protein [Roseibium denhamense]MTI06552.1 hypothetical protein [Roseibium denhamense]SMP04897.1 hypothetical protein SAMN06265374_0668 [Roseibium denhamense]
MAIQTDNNKTAKAIESRTLWFVLGALIVAGCIGAYYYIQEEQSEPGLSIELGLPNGEERELNLALPGADEG